MNEFYTIGEVAKRTGLSVSAIRFYCDAGIVAPSRHTTHGHRRFDLHAIAGLELIRTLRELDAGLDDIRRLLSGELTLQALAAAHLDIVEAQLNRFEARRAVLRAIVHQDTETDQVLLMHQLVSMADEDRAQLIEDFWRETTDGLVLHDFVGELRPLRPELPMSPSGEQLQAWIELATLVQRSEFRKAVRQFLHETFAAGPPDEQQPATDMDEQHDILMQARTAAEANVLPDSLRGRELAARWVAAVAAHTGNSDVPEVQRHIIKGFPAQGATRHADLLGRYHALTATINGTTLPDVRAAPASAWLQKAVAALG
ncbi:MerR family transcriptional regulator [Actinoplanes sp. LDG1-06]|uniref:MerR family transcriptional regulator n=1 Tax=Paractinoplanes ovalisporus TaxID=2810368 RepID=A0ABS2AKR9_9ACTN|nr:MerR family transcriptional regulator [Actinoplanes ovalisporus]MBM2620459.1 MerR family transcriptional regulator [Actinoplanes ovalisporus]